MSEKIKQIAKRIKELRKISGLSVEAVAGEPLNPEVYNQFLQLTGLKLMEGYGQTECTVALATYPWVTPKPGSMGKPSPGNVRRILPRQETDQLGLA